VAWAATSCLLERRSGCVRTPRRQLLSRESTGERYQVRLAKAVVARGRGLYLREMLAFVQPVDCAAC
jgi:hypothetical protein